MDRILNCGERDKVEPKAADITFLNEPSCKTFDFAQIFQNPTFKQRVNVKKIKTSAGPWSEEGSREASRQGMAER